MRCNFARPRCSNCETRFTDCGYDVESSSHFHTSDKGWTAHHTWVASTKASAVSSESTQNVVNEINSRNLTPASASIEELLDIEFSTGINNSDGDTIYGMNDLEWNMERNMHEARTSKGLEIATGVGEGVCGNTEDTCWFQGSSSRAESTTRTLPIPITQDGEFAREIKRMAINMIKGTSLMISGLRALEDWVLKLPNFLRRKPGGKMSELAAGNYVWAQMKSFPTQFVKADFPPFVHRNYLTANVSIRAGDLSEPFANSTSIIAMYQSKTPACTSLVSKTLLLEVQRLYEEYHEYSDRLVLHSLQVLIAYTLAIAADDERCKLIGLVVAILMGEIATEVQEKGHYSVSEQNGNFPRWEEWIYAESRRRTMITLHLLDKVIDLRIGDFQSAPCQVMDQIPLPCQRSMWEAETVTEWETEYKNYLQNRKGGQMLTIGDLRASRQQDIKGLNSDVVEDIATWATGVDSLGAMLLTSILAI